MNRLEEGVVRQPPTVTNFVTRFKALSTPQKVGVVAAAAFALLAIGSAVVATLALPPIGIITISGALMLSGITAAAATIISGACAASVNHSIKETRKPQIEAEIRQIEAKMKQLVNGLSENHDEFNRLGMNCPPELQESFAQISIQLAQAKVELAHARIELARAYGEPLTEVHIAAKKNAEDGFEKIKNLSASEIRKGYIGDILRPYMKSGKVPAEPIVFSDLMLKKFALSMGLEGRADARVEYDGGRDKMFNLDIANVCRASHHIDNATGEQLSAAFAGACDNLANPDRTSESIRQGKLVIIPTGWLRHLITVVFYENHLYICNRGAGAEEISSTSSHALILDFEIDSKKMTKEIINQINRATCDSYEKGVKFFKETLPTLLSHDGKVKRGKTTLSNAMQIVGNCTFASMAQALYLSIFLLSNKPESDCRAIYRKMVLDLQLSYLDQYVKSTKGQPHFDAEGVREGVIKLLEKLQKTPMDLSSYPNAAAAILDLQLDDLDHYVRFMKDRPYYDTESVRENAIKLIKKLKDTPMDLSPYPNAAAVLSDAYRNNLQNRQDVA